MFCFVDHAELSKRYTNSLFKFYLFVCFMVFNATFINISVISWWSVLLVKETGVPGEKQPTCRKSPTNFITLCCTPLPDGDSNSQLQW